MSRYLELFVSEARQHVQDAERELTRVASSGDPEGMNALFRHFHSLKGMAASMGFAEIAGLSHAVEDLFEEMRESAPGGSAQPLADLVLETLDTLSSMIETASGGGKQFPAVDGLVAKVSSQTARLRAERGAAAASPSRHGEGSSPAAVPPPPAAPAQSPSPSASVYRCRLVIDHAADLPAARAALALRQMDALGVVLTSTPARETLGRGPFEGTLTVLLSTPLPRPQIAAALEGLLDVASYSVTEELLPSESTSKKEGPRESEAGLPSTIRIPTASLDHFLDTLGELITWRGGLSAALRSRDLASAGASYERLSRAIERLRGEVMQIRLLPFEHIVPHLHQSVRALARQTGKKVTLQISGTEVALDRAVLEEILDPLNHMLRNAVDHGIEPPEERLACAKDPVGRIFIAVTREGDRVRMKIEDDGRGMDAEAIARRAVKEGFIGSAGAAALGEEETLMLTTIPGFSTAETASEISGRGVGMDVVRTRIEKLGGHLSLASRRGRGVTITLDLPLTVVVIDAFLVVAAGAVFAVPASAASRTLLASREAVKRTRTGFFLDEGGLLIHAFRPDVVLGLAGEDRPLPPRTQVLLFSTEGARGALAVDEILERRELVVKPLGPPLEHLMEYSGAALLDDGRIALILDLPNLVRQSGAA